jgi:hypothetical protein
MCSRVAASSRNAAWACCRVAFTRGCVPPLCAALLLHVQGCTGSTVASPESAQGDVGSSGRPGRPNRTASSVGSSTLHDKGGCVDDLVSVSSTRPPLHPSRCSHPHCTVVAGSSVHANMFSFLSRDCSCSPLARVMTHRRRSTLLPAGVASALSPPAHPCSPSLLV